MKNAIYAYLILLAIIASGCEKIEKVEDFPLQPSKLVLNGRLEAGKPIEIEVSRSLVVIDNAPLSLVGEAELILFDDKNLEIERKNAAPFTFNTLAEEGKSYKVVAKHPVYGEAQAIVRVPGKPVVSSSEFLVMDSSRFNFSWQGGDTMYYLRIDLARLRLELKNPLQEKRYYAVKLDLVGFDEYGIEMPGSGYITFGADNTSGELISNILFLDEAFDYGEVMNLSLSVKGSVNSRQDRFKIYAECIAFNEDAWLFEKSYARYKESKDNPFADPVQVFSNVAGGYGIVGGSGSVLLNWGI